MGDGWCWLRWCLVLRRWLRADGERYGFTAGHLALHACIVGHLQPRAAFFSIIDASKMHLAMERPVAGKAVTPDAESTFLNI